MAAVDNYLIKIQLQLQGDKELKLLTQNMERAGVAAPKFQKAMKQTQIQARGSGRALQNVSYQLQDIIVQTSGGVDVFRSLSQQLPQMLINMGAFGAVVGVVAATLPLLIAGLRDSGEQAVEFSEAMENLESSLEGISSVTSQVDFTEWNKRWRESSDAVRETMDAMLAFRISFAETQLAVAKAASMREVMGESSPTFFDAIRGSIEGVNIELNNMYEIITKLVKLGGPFGQMLGLVLTTVDAMDETVAASEGRWERLGDRYGLTATQAEYLFSILKDGVTQDELNLIAQWNAELGNSSEAMRDLIKEQERLLQLENDIERSRSRAETGGAGGDSGGGASSSRYKQSAAMKLLAENMRWLNEQEKINQQIKKENIALWQKFYPELNKYHQAVTDIGLALDKKIISEEKSIELMKEAETAYRQSTEGLTLMEEGAALFNKSFETMLDGVLMGTQSIGEGFKDMARVIIAQLAKIAATKGIGNLLQSSGSSFLSEVGSSLLTPSADGNAFSRGNVVPFAKGGVVNGPTLFPMANGAGLMGEAGPEAVMPLRRGADGKLGVAGGGTNITINNMAPGVDVRTRETEQGLTIEVVMQQLTAAISQGGNDVSSAMETAYSLGRGRSVY